MNIHSIREVNNKMFTGKFCECLREFLITFKNQCKNVKKSENYKNNQLYFDTYLIFNYEKEDMILKILSLVNSDINSRNCCSEELLFKQAQNAMIKISFALDINWKFDNLFVDEILSDSNFNIKMINSSNNFMFYKNYMDYYQNMTNTSYTIDYFISEYINLNDFLESSDFMNKVSYLLN